MIIVLSGINPGQCASEGIPCPPRTFASSLATW